MRHQTNTVPPVYAHQSPVGHLLHTLSEREREKERVRKKNMLPRPAYSPRFDFFGSVEWFEELLFPLLAGGLDGRKRWIGK